MCTGSLREDLCDDEPLVTRRSGKTSSLNIGHAVPLAFIAKFGWVTALSDCTVTFSPEMVHEVLHLTLN